MIEHPMILSTTEPNNSIGVIKIRQDDKQTQTFVVTVTEQGKPVDISSLKIFFCLSTGTETGKGIVENDPVKKEQIIDAKNGKFKYTLNEYDWQFSGDNTAYFSFRTLNDDNSWKEQFTTRDFKYTVTKSIYSSGIKDSNYIWSFEDLLRYLNEFIDTGQGNFNDFFDNIKDLLGTDPAGQLAIKIGLMNKFRKFDESLIEKMSNEFFERGLNVKTIGAKGDGVTDDTSIIQDGIDYLYNRSVDQNYGVKAGGKLIIPNGVYMVDTLYIPDNISIEGLGGRASIIKKISGKSGPILSFSTQNRSWNFQPNFKNFVVQGQGKDTDEQVDGIHLTPFWGFDGALFENIQVLNVSGIGVKLSPSPLNLQTSKMLFQQGTFRNMSIEYCGIGCWYQEGFVGNVVYDTITFEPYGSGYSFQTEVFEGHSAQDMTFLNCAFQFGGKGFISNTGYQGATFVGCHFEKNLINSFETNHKVNNLTNFSNCSFSTTPTDLLINQTSGYISFEGILYNPLASITTGNLFMKLTSSFRGLVWLGMSVVRNLNISYFSIEDPNNRIRGFTNNQATDFKLDRLSVRGISTSPIMSNNLTGRRVLAVNVNKSTITFNAPEYDSNYIIVATVDSTTQPLVVTVTDKTTTGFTVNVGGAAMPNNSIGVNWMLLR